MKFSEIKKGHRARRRGVPFCTLEGDEVPVDIGLIDGEGQSRILGYATAFAKDHGAEAKMGSPLYEFGVDIMTVALGVLEHRDAPEGADPERTAPGEPAERFFRTPEEVLDGCDRDRIRMLAEQQRRLQALVSPAKLALSNEEYWQMVIGLAGSEERDSGFFDNWAPGLRWSFERSMAMTLLEMGLQVSQTPKSSDSSKTEPSVAPGSLLDAITS
jgi:hypothetical protein